MVYGPGYQGFRDTGDYVVKGAPVRGAENKGCRKGRSGDEVQTETGGIGEGMDGEAADSLDFIHAALFFGLRQNRRIFAGGVLL